jgi:hypothetical protein
MIPMWTIEVGKDGNVHKEFLRATTSTGHSYGIWMQGCSIYDKVAHI